MPPVLAAAAMPHGGRHSGDNALLHQEHDMTTTLAILAALPEEISDLLDEMGTTATTHRIGMRDYHVGTLHGQRCVIALARVGKVAAAATTVVMIREFNASMVIFTGLAGGIHPDVRIGDVVVASSLIQHDLDARPLFAQYEVPLLSCTHFETEAEAACRLQQCAAAFFEDGFAAAVSPQTRRALGVMAPRVHVGLIATGDRFVSAEPECHALRSSLPQALCVEMEGAATAQVCHEFGVPFAVFRTISDRADSAATVDFTFFLNSIAKVYSAEILRRFLIALQPRKAQATG